VGRCSCDSPGEDGKSRRGSGRVILSLFVPDLPEEFHRRWPMPRAVIVGVEDAIP
jgi:hypothetical protein